MMHDWGFCDARRRKHTGTRIVLRRVSTISLSELPTGVRVDQLRITW